MNIRHDVDEIKQICSSIGFEYVGGYTDSNGFVDLRCPECGTVIKRTWNAVRKIARGYQRIFVCANCLEIKRAEREQKKILARTSQEKERDQRFWRQDFEQKTFSFCSRCGGIYIAKKNKKYCSKACEKAIQYSRAKDKRLAKIKNVHKDNIDLKRLYVRDGGVCWLCKTACDWNDYRRTETAFIAGENYPSIDHVIPLAKGGSHSWDNVRLAHRGCNTKKSDRVVEGMPPYVRFCG